jgi:hypothetical protein
MNHATPEHIKAVVDRANEIIQRAKLVNGAQYTHGINSTMSSIEYRLRELEKGAKWDYEKLNSVGSKVMQLAGYLFALQNNI